jgi:hypothetical protein
MGLRAHFPTSQANRRNSSVVPLAPRGKMGVTGAISPVSTRVPSFETSNPWHPRDQKLFEPIRQTRAGFSARSRDGRSFSCCLTGNQGPSGISLRWHIGAGTPSQSMCISWSRTGCFGGQRKNLVIEEWNISNSRRNGAWKANRGRWILASARYGLGRGNGPQKSRRRWRRYQ